MTRKATQLGNGGKKNLVMGKQFQDRCCGTWVIDSCWVCLGPYCRWYYPRSQFDVLQDKKTQYCCYCCCYRHFPWQCFHETGWHPFVSLHGDLEVVAGGEERRAETSLCPDRTCSAGASFAGSHHHPWEENCHSSLGKVKEGALQGLGGVVHNDNQAPHWETSGGGWAS